uniref:Membrane-bound transport protein n=1 Tax=Thermoclostridium stercorarium TaxID=1510 RepID=Q8GJ39_THEST|nr:membrane-bound transport protein [Thermoclostridium stercorarium]
MLVLDHSKGFLNSSRELGIMGLEAFTPEPINSQFIRSFDLQPPDGIPHNFSLENFGYAIEMMDYWRTLLNTALLCLLTTVLTLVSCGLAGYGFARLKFKGSNLLFAGVILTICPRNGFTPLSDQKDLRNGLTLDAESVNGSFGRCPYFSYRKFIKIGLFIFIFMQFLQGIPRELEEAAYVDGAGVTRTFTSIMLPNAVPAIVTVSLFSFVCTAGMTRGLHNNVIPGRLSNAHTAGIIAYNLSIKLPQYSADGKADPFYLSMVQDTGILLAMLPLIILYIFTQRYFVESIERTGIVG